MIGTVLAAVAAFRAPTLDYHALAPEIVLTCVIVAVLVIDLFVSERSKWVLATLSGFGLLAAFVPVVTLAVDGADRSMFNGAWVVDNFALVLKGLFLLSAYVVVLLSSDEIETGGYHQGEYYTLLLSSVLGMTMMASSRDLVSIFVALELLSIPAYMLAAWRKRDLKSNEAGLKYLLLGVFASAVMLYGMSLLYGVAGSTVLTDISAAVAKTGDKSIIVLAVVFILVGFAFKVSAVPFHSWAPDTYEGAPTPVTAFLSVASKAAGFVALIELVFVAFPSAKHIWQPLFWVLAAASMTLGNLVALRQTNIVRMFAYSSIAQGGFILMPLAVAGYGGQSGRDSLTAMVTYLAVYAAMNLGAFAIIIAVARKTRSGAISSYGGLFGYAPGLAVAMTIFLAALAGIPPAGGWIAKFYVFKAVMSAGPAGVVLGIVGVVNSVIAFGYYGNVMREIWMRPAPDGDTAPIKVPGSLSAALVLTGTATLLIGVLPSVVLRFGNLTNLAGALGK